MVLVLVILIIKFYLLLLLIKLLKDILSHIMISLILVSENIIILSILHHMIDYQKVIGINGLVLKIILKLHFTQYKEC